VRRFLHAAGFRFRLHRRDLPGRPDIVLPKLRSVVLVHGCFWHRHPRCRFATTPTSNVAFWRAKFRANRARDRQVHEQLEELGWRVLVIWECETRSSSALDALARRLREDL
jgi:DNA mismatch endonuclease (patch repair protein)